MYTFADDARFNTAEETLYLYACGKLTAKRTKQILLDGGFRVDLRVWRANACEALDLVTGRYVWIEC